MRYLTTVLLAVMVAAGCGDADEPRQPSVAPTTSAAAAEVTTTTSAPQQSEDETTTSIATTSTVPIGSLDDLDLEFSEAASGFRQPVLMLTSPIDERWFVVDQPGVIWVVDGGDPTVFLDISQDVSFGGEQGLLGMAFHPDFASNNLFYIYYINGRGSSIIESVRASGQSASNESRIEILTVDQPAGNHNGGMLIFGPDDNLWIGFGDGGGSNDQFGQGQRQDTLLASMVRITVGPDIDTYDIPEGNLEGEVWATGLRNPWRFTFDGDDLWIADVGQNRIEEVDVVDWTDGNPNFGWPIMEGTECFSSSSCDPSGLVQPIYEYSHGEGCSITGGIVYRGSAMPELNGHFLFAEYCTGWLRSVDREGNMHQWFEDGTFSGATGFGVDAAGEPHVLIADGSVFRLSRAG